MNGLFLVAVWHKNIVLPSCQNYFTTVFIMLSYSICIFTIFKTEQYNNTRSSQLF